LFPRFFGITNTLRPVFSEPPELELAVVVLVAAVLLVLAAAGALLADEELLLDPPHAAMLAIAAVNATAIPTDRPIRRAGNGRFPTSCI
jgi:hypothetical protein